MTIPVQAIDLTQLFQANSVAESVQLTVPVLAAVPIIEPIAVADVEARLAAIPPHRELNEPRKDPGKAAVELSCVDTVGN